MAAHIDQSVSSLRKAEEDYVGCGLVSLPDLATTLLDVVGQPEEYVTKLKDLMKQYVDMDNDVKSYIRSVEQISNLVSTSSIATDEIAAKLEEVYAVEQKKNPPVNHHKSYKALERNIAGALGEADADNGETRELGDDEELMVQEETQSFKCPYTGKEMVDPVKNTNCGHSYDKQGILTYIKQRGKRAKCPFSGCMNQGYITRSCLIADTKMKKAIDKLNKQKR